MARPRIRVVASRGVIDVNSASVLMKSSDVVWIHVDTKQKYPDLVAICDDDGVWLGASEQTLHVVDPKLPTTQVRVVGLVGKWRLFTEMGRYSLNMVFVRDRGYDPDRPDILELEPEGKVAER